MEIYEPREVPLGGLRAMDVRRTLPRRGKSLIGAWCFLDHYGPDDVALTPEGRQEVHAAAAMLDEIAFDRVITSGLPRTVETARVVVDAAPRVAGVSARRLASSARSVDRYGSRLDWFSDSATRRPTSALTAWWC